MEYRVSPVEVEESIEDLEKRLAIYEEELAIFQEQHFVNAGQSFDDTETTYAKEKNASIEVEENCIEQEEIAIDHIRKWLSICDSQHTCNRPGKDMSNNNLPTRVPSYLIDTTDYCIVPGNDEKSYVALSYTWNDGARSSVGKPSYQLLQRNRDALLKPFALLTRERLMSKVIPEAIKMTKLIGLRYLWVDQLCIIQDEESAAKHEEISNMDHIYSGAAVTLVASARHGLFERIFRKSVRREIATPAGPSEIAQVSVTRRELDDEAMLSNYTSISESTWAKRGWTYQEAILSKRVVFFHDDIVFWQCGCTVWDMDHPTPDEDTSIAASDIAKRTLTRHFSTPSSLDFGLYMDLICPYNGRDFTHEEDALLACTGILNRLAPAFPGGFLYGLPVALLDYALLWQPLKGCHRRISFSSKKPSLPSWAWCGWQCLVDPWSFQPSFCLDESDTVRISKAGSWSLKRLISWKAKVIAQEHISVDETFPLSDTPESLAFLKEASRSSHNNGNADDSGDGSTTLRRTLEDIKLPRDELALLACDTELAIFAPAAALEIFLVKPDDMMFSMDAFWDPAMNEEELEQSSKVVVLQDQNGSFAGLVRVTENLDCARFEWTMRSSKGMKTEYGDDLVMGMIAISEGTATRGDIRMSFEEKVFHRSPYYSGGCFQAEHDIDGWWTGSSERDPDNFSYQVLPSGKWNENLILPEEAASDDEVVEFYNVLWVQKGDDQISRRLGCGRVLKDRWRQNEPRIVSVTLG